MNGRRIDIVVLISGNGSNLQSFIDAVANGRLNANIVAVFSNKPDAYGLRRAQRSGIATRVVEPSGFDDRLSYDLALLDEVDSYQPDLVILAGFMRILSPVFVRHFQGRMLNIHPSLLPAYRGLHTHRRVLANGDSAHGCSIHFVTDVLDGGPLVAQAIVAVTSDDDETSLSARVQALEHKLYPLVAVWFADGRLRQRDECVWLDNKPLHSPVRFETEKDIA